MNKPRSNRRAGLAPLELVLVLPILLFVMALMIILGTAGAWKIRTQINARQAVWRALEHRSGENDPHPGNWPDDAGMRVSSASPSPLPADPFANAEVVRGPVVIDPQTGEYLPVKPDVLDVLPGLLAGSAEIQRPYPLLRRLPGDIHFERNHQVLDGTRFQYPSMDLGSNVTRRIPSLYPLLLELRAPEEAGEYLEAAIAVYFDPNEEALTPLTGGDPEIRQLLGERSPNFQPPLLNAGDWRQTVIPQVRTRVPDYCEANPDTVRSAKVERLLRSVHNVPHDVSDYYLSRYNRKIRQLENQRQSLLQSMPPQVQQAQQVQAQIDELTAKRDQVRTFRASLPPRQ